MSGASTLDMAPPLGLRVRGPDNLLLLLRILTMRRGLIGGFLDQIRQAGELTEVGASEVGGPTDDGQQSAEVGGLMIYD